MITQAGAVGHAPNVLIKPIEAVNPELSKYQRMWDIPDYRTVSPGEHWAQLFLQQAKPPRDSEAIDFGCGTGRGAWMLCLFGNMRVKMIDFAANCLDHEVAESCITQASRISFEVGDLTKPIAAKAAYGYCCDVMEHIPPQDVATVLANILDSANHVFFGIATEPDVMGERIGEQLHLTVQPLAWWVDQLKALGAVVHWSQDFEGACAIYCTSWKNAKDIVKIGRINTDEAVVDAQVKSNILAGWGHALPHDRQDREIALLAGGPSMAAHVEDIKALREAGCAIVTVNGAYDWALENWIKVSAQIVLDAREFNARFTRNVQADCKYLIASQVHPSTLAGLPRDRTLLWHSGVNEEAEALIREAAGAFYPIPGGSTVVLRAIPLLMMLGFRRMHVFGFDSCMSETGNHHAYQQTENDSEFTMPVTCGGRTFTCTPWMLSQATEFMDLVKFLGDEVELQVHGDGLISHILKTGADLSDIAESK
jgi:hypothetical protein